MLVIVTYVSNKRVEVQGLYASMYYSFKEFEEKYELVQDASDKATPKS
jgi:hypothetical protein